MRKLDVRNDLCEGEIYLHGAHITRFHPRGQEQPVLFLSDAAVFAPGKPIRGGVPICFPWFGPKADDANAPIHGFARVMEWELEDAPRTNTGRATTLTLKLGASDATRAIWPVDFTARYTVTFGSALTMSLMIRNNGQALARCEAALHSYFTVGDIRQVRVEGLDNAGYLDRLRPGEAFRQDDRPITFAAETDRTYLATPATTTIVDPVLNRRVRIEKSGSRSTVVWNPWIAKSKAMADFGDDEWTRMLCIETANAASDAMTVAPGGSHTITATISVV